MIGKSKSFFKRQIIKYLNHQFDNKSLKILLINGHMRSGSSLLVHILNSHPRIIGYGETHCSYQNKSDFGKIAFKIYRAFNKFYVSEDYILDKIVHSTDVKNVDLLNDIKTIFLIRSPLQTLPSIHKLNPEKYPPSVTFNYYIDRIKNIRKTARKLDPEKWTYTTYDELINNQAKTFRKIEKLLMLSTKLSSSYDTIWSTGIRGIGDGSSHIHKGKIIQDKKAKKLPESLKPYLEKADKIYIDCLNTLAQAQNAYLK